MLPSPLPVPSHFSPSTFIPPTPLARTALSPPPPLPPAEPPYPQLTLSDSLTDSLLPAHSFSQSDHRSLLSPQAPPHFFPNQMDRLDSQENASATRHLGVSSTSPDEPLSQTSGYMQSYDSDADSDDSEIIVLRPPPRFVYSLL